MLFFNITHSSTPVTAYYGQPAVRYVLCTEFCQRPVWYRDLIIILSVCIAAFYCSCSNYQVAFWCLEYICAARLSDWLESCTQDCLQKWHETCFKDSIPILYLAYHNSVKRWSAASPNQRLFLFVCTLIVPTIGRCMALSTKQPRVRGNSEKLFLIWRTVCLLIKLCILVIHVSNVKRWQHNFERIIIMLPRYNKTIVAMGFVHP